MAVTGKTGADGFAKAVKRQSLIYAHYGPKLRALVLTMQGLGLLEAAEASALLAAFDSLPAILSAIAKVAEYSGF